MSKAFQTEIVPDFDSGDIACRRCGKVMHLYFNGGELDETECCGLLYMTESTGHQLVISELPAQQQET